IVGLLPLTLIFTSSRLHGTWWSAELSARVQFVPSLQSVEVAPVNVLSPAVQIAAPAEPAPNATESTSAASPPSAMRRPLTALAGTARGRASAGTPWTPITFDLLWLRQAPHG